MSMLCLFSEKRNISKIPLEFSSEQNYVQWKKELSADSLCKLEEKKDKKMRHVSNFEAAYVACFNCWKMRRY